MNKDLTIGEFFKLCLANKAKFAASVALMLVLAAAYLIVTPPKYTRQHILSGMTQKNAKPSPSPAKRVRSSFALASLYLHSTFACRSDQRATLLRLFSGVGVGQKWQWKNKCYNCYSATVRLRIHSFAGRISSRTFFFTNPCVVHGKNVYLQSGNQHSHWAPRHKIC